MGRNLDLAGVEVAEVAAAAVAAVVAVIHFGRLEEYLLEYPVPAVAPDPAASEFQPAPVVELVELRC